MTPALAVGLLAALAATADGGADAPPPPAIATVEVPGRVVLDAFSSRLGLPAVAFDHWRHRTMYTCRVCHADLGFALGAGETQVSAESNEDGSHCGACHDGETLHEGRPVFRACWGWPRADAARGCTRCHTGPSPDPGPRYEELRRRLPLDATGEIDWAAAARQGLVKPLDAVEGVPVKRPSMKLDRDLTIAAVGTWLKAVTFSHRRHAQWTGCGLCHPEVFPVTARGAARYRMDDVRAGRYCGACHGSVAFALDACQRCHAEDRRPMR